MSGRIKFQFLVFLCPLFIIAACSSVQDRVGPEQRYRVFTGSGELSSLEALVASSRGVDVTFIGENHDDAVAHYLEALILELSWDEELVLSLEMFETDVQYVVDEYLEGLIREDHLLASGRAWSRYDTDYKPMIEFMKAKEGKVIAANPPRRYVNMVSRNGQEALLELSPKAKAFLPPLPYAGASEPYATKFKKLMSDNGAFGVNTKINDERAEENGNTRRQEILEREQRIERALQAQSLWDAGMAWSIGRQLTDNEESRVLHINGSFHSAKKLGIPEHLQRYRPETSLIVVTIMASEGFPSFDDREMAGIGDYVIVTDAR